jgi:hypothetical protein
MGRVSEVNVGFGVLTTMVMKSTIFWDITPCSPLKVNRRFGGKCYLYRQGRRIIQAGFLLGFVFDHEDGSDIFLRNVGWLSTDYTALYPRRQNSSEVSVELVQARGPYP